MTVLGTSSHPGFATSRIEIDRAGPTYTVDTLSRVHEWHGPNLEILFIVGADALSNLGTWRETRRLSELCEIVAVTRPGSDLWAPIDQLWPHVHRLEIPGVAISSTEIRARVQEGRPVDWLVPVAVADYIRAHGLYLAENEARGA